MWAPARLGSAACASWLERSGSDDKRVGHQRQRSFLGRFSTVATVALVTVAVAGLVLTVVVLPSPAALWQTSFGMLLVVKIAVVGVVAAAGAHNHRHVVPVLASDPGDEHANSTLMRMLGVEVVGFLAIVALTAALVSASAA
jgi:copper transport protein